MEKLFAIKSGYNERSPFSIEEITVVKETAKTVYVDGMQASLGFRKLIPKEEAERRFSSPEVAVQSFLRHLLMQRTKLEEELSRVNQSILEVQSLLDV